MSYTKSLKVESEVMSLMRPHLNRLERLLQEKQGKGATSVGQSLNGSRLTKSYVHALTGQTNSDRYHKRRVKPQTDFAVSIVADASVSMDDREKKNSDRVSLFHVQNATMVALSDGLTKIGGKVAYGFGNYHYQEHRPKGAQSHSTPLFIEVKGFDQKRISEESKKSMYTRRAFTGTDVIAYAESACQLLLNRQEKHKLAVVLTDMECSIGNMLVLEDLSAQYKHRHGVTLCFVALATGLPIEIPNACVAYTGEEIGSKVLPFIIEQIKK